MKCWWIDVPLYLAVFGGLAYGLVLALGSDTAGIAVMAVAGVFLIGARYSSPGSENGTDPELDAETALLQVLRQM